MLLKICLVPPPVTVVRRVASLDVEWIWHRSVNSPFKYIYIMCIVGSYIYIYLSIIMYIFPLMNSQTFPIKSLKRKCLKVLWWAILIGKARVNKSTYYLKKNRCFRLFLNSGSSKKEWFVNMVFGAAIIDWFLVGAKQWHCMRVWCGEQLIYSEISNDL